MQLKCRLRNGGHFVSASMFYHLAVSKTPECELIFSIVLIASLVSYLPICKTIRRLYDIYFTDSEFLHKGQWHGALMFSLICTLKRLSELSWRRWFETPSCSLWRHCNVPPYLVFVSLCYLCNAFQDCVIVYITSYFLFLSTTFRFTRCWNGMHSSEIYTPQVRTHDISDKYLTDISILFEG